MELYEIIKTTFEPGDRWTLKERPYVITAVMDKDLAYNILDIYKANQDENEAYEIRTVRMPEVKEW